MIRRIYIRMVRAAAPVLRLSGLDRWLPRSRFFWLRHLWSLSAIYDVERMAVLGKPWWIYEAIDEVEEFLAARDGTTRVFEYGAGSSTLWLAPRAGEVHSVEHDGQFVEALRPRLADHDNVTLHHVGAAPRRPDSTAVSGHAGDEHLDFAEYARTIDSVGGTFDLIVVDGRARVTCLEAAVSHLAADGLLVFDDAHRDRYADGLAHCGLRVDVRKGLAPSVPWPETTALLRPLASDTADTVASS